MNKRKRIWGKIYPFIAIIGILYFIFKNISYQTNNIYAWQSGILARGDLIPFAIIFMIGDFFSRDFKFLDKKLNKKKKKR